MPSPLKSSGRGLGIGADTLKVAVTLRAASIVTVHPPAPVQAPLQPAKVEPSVAAALRLTVVPLANEALQLVPHALAVTLLLARHWLSPLKLCRILALQKRLKMLQRAKALHSARYISGLSETF